MSGTKGADSEELLTTFQPFHIQTNAGWKGSNAACQCIYLTRYLKNMKNVTAF